MAGPLRLSLKFAECMASQQRLLVQTVLVLVKSEAEEEALRFLASSFNCFKQWLRFLCLVGLHKWRVCHRNQDHWPRPLDVFLIVEVGHNLDVNDVSYFIRRPCEIERLLVLKKTRDPNVEAAEHSALLKVPNRLHLESLLDESLDAVSFVKLEVDRQVSVYVSVSLAEFCLLEYFIAESLPRVAGYLASPRLRVVSRALAAQAALLRRSKE
jgi:hypothetical protein